jgi:hypothetical protein
MIFDGATTC